MTLRDALEISIEAVGLPHVIMLLLVLLAVILGAIAVLIFIIKHTLFADRQEKQK